MGSLTYLVALASLVQLCAAYKILVVFPIVGKSHNILGRAYVKHLLDAGHEVTYVTPFPTNKTTDMYHEVDLSKNVEEFEKKNNMFNLKVIMDKTSDMNSMAMLPQMLEMLRKTIQNENLMKFLGDTSQHFDAVIQEWLFTDAYAGFATVYNCPLIWSSSTEPHWMVIKLMHEPSNPAFNPSILSTSVPPYSFVERATTLLVQIAFTALNYLYSYKERQPANFRNETSDAILRLRNLLLENPLYSVNDYFDMFSIFIVFFYKDNPPSYIGPGEKALYEEYFGPFVTMRGRPLPPYHDVLYNASLMLTNSHTSLSQPISVPPNVKEISGYHIDANTKPLPADLQKLMDEAEHGVIYFSMGSNAKSKDFPDELKQDFLRVFGELKQTVLWKFEEKFKTVPKNVHILQWAPQQSILAHPNLRLFITHGGLLSTTEAVFFGVPTIVMPYGLDQHLNAQRAVNKGYALKVDLSYEMAGDMKTAIEEMLGNPKYAERSRQLSQIYHDRTIPPAKELVHWVEHVIKTGGAPHLRSPALLLPWYQKMYLDLLALVLVALYVTKLVLCKLCCIGKSLLVNLGLLKSPVNKKKKD